MIYATFVMTLVSMIVVKFGCYQFFWSQICIALHVSCQIIRTRSLSIARNQQGLGFGDLYISFMTTFIKTHDCCNSTSFIVCLFGIPIFIFVSIPSSFDCEVHFSRLAWSLCCYFKGLFLYLGIKQVYKSASHQSDSVIFLYCTHG